MLLIARFIISSIEFNDDTFFDINRRLRLIIEQVFDREFEVNLRLHASGVFLIIYSPPAPARRLLLQWKVHIIPEIDHQVLEYNFLI
jgi:hypothetical protein